jgi:adenylyl-sulfate kinase
MNRGLTIWFTGLSGAGKSTLATMLACELEELDCRVELLDGDEVRKNLSSGLGFSKADRDANIRRIAYVAKLLSRNGVVAITAAISPYREVRDEARSEIHNFVEVFVDCPIEVCERRDVKGLYARARRGEIAQFTGASDPYEPPLNPEVTVYTHLETPEESVDRILAVLDDLG